jgi:hypothetical protein
MAPGGFAEGGSRLANLLLPVRKAPLTARIFPGRADAYSVKAGHRFTSGVND